MRKNKKGWIKVLEAFVAIAFILGVVTVLSLNTRHAVNNEVSYAIQDFESDTFSLIQMNESLRGEIVNLGNLPLEMNDVGFPGNLSNLIYNKTLQNINCTLRICNPESICESQNSNLPSNEEIYVNTVIISSSHKNYNPKKLAMFCWKI